jgi:type II secretory pathway pseudopilin PulG
MTARDRLVLVVVAVVAAVAAGWFLVVTPKRDEASQLSSQVSSVQAQLDSTRQQVTAAQLARTTFASSYTAVARLGEAVPADDNVASLIFQVQSAASTTGVDFAGLSLASSSSSPSAPSAPVASASAAQANTAALPPGATVGPAGFPTEPFTFTFSGDFFHLSDFFGHLQQFVQTVGQRIAVRGRLLSLNAIQLGPGPKGFPEITATVSANTYLLPTTQGLQAGASPSGPAGAPPASSTPVSGSAGSSSAPVAPAVIGGSR